MVDEELLYKITERYGMMLDNRVPARDALEYIKKAYSASGTDAYLEFLLRQSQSLDSGQSRRLI